MRTHDSGIIPTYQIALVQMRPDFLDRDANLEKAEAALRSAAANGAKLVCFPESFDLGYDNTRIPEMISCIQSGESPALTRMCALAKELQIFILTPLFWKNQDGNVENRAFLIDDEGNPSGSYSKTHLTADERSVLVRGTDYPVFHTKLGAVGIALCYDICFPETARVLALNGAHVLLVPAAWRGGNYYTRWWDMDLRSQALDNLVYTVGINMIGPANSNEEFAGHSQICSPVGEQLCHCAQEETILYGWIDLHSVTEARRANTVFSDRHPLDYRRICEQ